MKLSFSSISVKIGLNLGCNMSSILFDGKI